jgi:hypothetical protein
MHIGHRQLILKDTLDFSILMHYIKFGVKTQANGAMPIKDGVKLLLD